MCVVCCNILNLFGGLLYFCYFCCCYSIYYSFSLVPGYISLERLIENLQINFHLEKSILNS